MNKEVKEICMKCELEFHKRGKGCAFRSLGNEYCDLIENFNKSITNYQNQVEKLTQENNDLEERVIHQDNVIKRLKDDKELLLNIISKAIFELRKYKLVRDNKDFVSLSAMYEFLIDNSIEILGGKNE